MKLKRVIVLVVLVILAIVIGFFVYKKVTDNSTKYVEVKFIDDYNHETLSTQTLEVGNDAEVPDEPKHEGCKFSGWYNSSNEKIESFKNIQSDLIAYAKCSDLYYKVKFIDSISKRVIDTQKVKYGDDAVAPVAPKHYGYNFVRWKGNYSNVTSNLVVSAIYGMQNAKYIVKYYTVDDGNETLYATKTFNSYVNRKVTASIISISGYQYNKNYSLNKLSGRVSADSTLVLKVYYDSKTYKIIINGEETVYNYDDEIKLPSLEKTVTLEYQENEAVTERLSSNNVDLTLVGYCKNSSKCDDVIPPGTVINVKENAEYYPVWKMDMELNLPAGNGYELDGETYSFAKWIGPDNVYYFEGDKIRFTDDLTLIALYKKDGTQEETRGEYTVNTYRDGELYSSITEYGNIGDEVLGSLYVKTVGGYEVESYTSSIFITETPSDNVIEIFYVTGENEDAPIITRKKLADPELELEELPEDDLLSDEVTEEEKPLDEKIDNADFESEKPILDSDSEGEVPPIVDSTDADEEEDEKESLTNLDEDDEKQLLDSNDDEKENEEDEKSFDEPDSDEEEKDVDDLIPDSEDKKPLIEELEKQDDDKVDKVPEKDIVNEVDDTKKIDDKKVSSESTAVVSNDGDKTIEAPPKVDTTPEKNTASSKTVETINNEIEEEM